MGYRLLVSIVLFFTMISSYADNAEVIKITGKVIDALESKPIEFANVALYSADSVFVSGVNSDENGDFSLNCNDLQNHYLAISYLGYETRKVELGIAKKNVRTNDIALRPSTVQLKDVVVTADGTFKKIDRDVILPSEIQLKTSTSGINLLQNLSLPRLIIDQVNNSIKLANGGEVQIRINGILSEFADVQALQPDDIIRVEYHDNPGLRYGNAEIVVDFITRHKQSGGSVNAEIHTNPFNGFTNGSLNVKFNHKRSEFALSGFTSHRDLDFTRSNEESFIFPDGKPTLSRRIEGEKTPFMQFYVSPKLTYSFREAGKYFFTASFRWASNNSPYGFQDVKGNVYSNDQLIGYMDRHDKYSFKMPLLDLYYQRELKNKQIIILNAVGRFQNFKETHSYEESRNNELMTDILNTIDGKRYSMVLEGIYEKTFENGAKLSTGLKHTQTYSKAEYKENGQITVDQNLAESYAYSEFQQKLGKFNYSIGIGVSRNDYRQGDVKEVKYTYHPSLKLNYNFTDNIYARYNVSVYNRAPSIYSMNPVVQSIDSLRSNRGNPNLNTYMTYQQVLSAGFKKSFFSADLRVDHRYQNKPIMDQVEYVDGKFMTQPNNQKAFHHLQGELTLKFEPFKNHLTIGFVPGILRYISEGNNYTHTYTQWRFSTFVNANYKKWMFNLQLWDRYDYFQEETLYGGEVWQDVNIGYKTDRFSIWAGMINLFKDWNMKTENWSTLNPSSSRAISNNISQMPYIKISYNINFGRQFKSVARKVDNTGGEGK